MILNDADIRPSLIQFLSSKAIKPKRIIEELHVHRGNAIADVVTIHSEAHCYEIKGDQDKIDRLFRQAQFYNKAFNKITLVTTERKLKEALKKTQDFWGIIVAYPSETGIRFRHVRKAKNSPSFNKELALATLWKKELSDINSEYQLDIPEKLNKREIATEISEKLNKSQIKRSIAKSLALRISYQ